MENFYFSFILFYILSIFYTLVKSGPISRVCGSLYIDVPRMVSANSVSPWPCREIFVDHLCSSCRNMWLHFTSPLFLSLSPALSQTTTNLPKLDVWLLLVPMMLLVVGVFAAVVVL